VHDNNDMNQLLEGCKELILLASSAIMRIYKSDDFEVEIKIDSFHSPLTKADKEANKVIVEGLKRISKYPVVSEEGVNNIRNSDIFWLVDPLDGTKEFIKHNGEFTVNIGLIKNGKPILGVVYAPAMKTMYFAADNIGAFKQEDDKKPVRIMAINRDAIPTVVVSRSHLDVDTEKFLHKMGKHRIISMGSSLKLCMVADGRATAYPRFSPTSLWDTAAADAIVRAAGGIVMDKTGRNLTYNPAHNILNPNFIVTVEGKDYLNLFD
jgi:3'(2'), 5'-bisphosphate nucleotidase